MIHNDVLRRLRYALSINDTAAVSLFKLVEYDMDLDYLRSIMKKEGEEGYLPCRDKIISLFLDGLIIKNRGKQEGVKPTVLASGQRLSNNEVLRKIRIAMSYKDDDMIDILALANFRIGKSEFSALFRKPDHRNYKAAGDQLVRNVLQGMVKKYRPDAANTAHTKEQVKDNIKAKTQARKNKPNKPNSIWG
ncbi:DUF1456 family protein [Alteromonas sp. 5E99-2]|uniref:DUF1456 family protein n=1 Tax=Alteromonas sp. 5E99-2 TaxID=2817683 RepID=UPI001A988EA0|nr:DUF1456 family protein [Alteromonas sp. 5E99-2]MBO1256109.1 DUF1456 family protein [Alteromonas sp. 5E99-2]